MLPPFRKAMGRSRELPRVAEGAGQEFAGFRVIDDSFVLGVPFEFAADALAIFIVAREQRDQAKMAWNG